MKRRISLDLAGVPLEVEAVNVDILEQRLTGYMRLSEKNAEAEKTVLTGAPPQPLYVRIRPEDIAKERELVQRYWQSRGVEIPCPSDAYCEFEVLHRKVLDELIHYRIIHLHGTAICVNGRGYLFTAPSGTGKSTHARLWRERFGDEVIMINDDKPLIRVRKLGADENEERGIYVCGSPWNGKHNLGCQMEAPLRAVVRLRRGRANEIRPLDKAEAFKELFLQTYHFDDSEKMEIVMQILAHILAEVPCYSLSCNMDIEAAEVARDALEDESYS